MARTKKSKPSQRRRAKEAQEKEAKQQQLKNNNEIDLNVAVDDSSSEEDAQDQLNDINDGQADTKKPQEQRKKSKHPETKMQVSTTFPVIQKLIESTPSISNEEIVEQVSKQFRVTTKKHKQHLNLMIHAARTNTPVPDFNNNNSKSKKRKQVAKSSTETKTQTGTAQKRKLEDKEEPDQKKLKTEISNELTL